MKKKIGIVFVLIFILSSLSVSPAVLEGGESFVGELVTYTGTLQSVQYRYCPVIDVQRGCPTASPQTGWVVASNNQPALSAGGGDVVLANLDEQLMEKIQAAQVAQPAVVQTVAQAPALTEGNLCYNIRRANAHPVNPCFETIPRAIQLIREFKGLQYPEVYQGSLDSNVAAEALYAEGVGFKQIAELKQQFEGIPPGLSLEAPSVSEGVKAADFFSITWDQPTNNLEFRIFSKTRSDFTYRVKFGGKTLQTVPETLGRKGDYIVFTLDFDEASLGAEDPEARMSTPAGLDSIEDFSAFFIERVDTGGNVKLILRPNNVVIIDQNAYQLFNLNTQDGIETGSLKLSYFFKDRIDVVFSPIDRTSLSRNTYSLIDAGSSPETSGVEYPLTNLRQDEQGNALGSIDLKNPQYASLLESLTKSDDVLFFLSLNIENPRTPAQESFTPAEISYNYARTVGEEGPTVIRAVETQPTTQTLTTSQEVVLFDLRNPAQYLSTAATDCSLSEGELEARAARSQTNLQGDVQGFITDVSTDPSRRVTLAGIAAAESRADVNVADSNRAARGLMQFVSPTAADQRVKFAYKSSYGSRCANDDAESSGECQLCTSNCANDARSEPDVSVAAADRLLDVVRDSIESSFRKELGSKPVSISERDWYLLTIAAYNAGEGSVGRAIKEVLDGKESGELTWEEVKPHVAAETRCYVPAVMYYSAYLAPQFNVDVIRGASAVPLSQDICSQECGSGVFNARCDRSECEEIGRDNSVFCQFTPAATKFLFTFERSGTCRLGTGGRSCPNVNPSSKEFPIQDPSPPLVSSCYGARTINGNPDWHDGIDFSVPVGTPVYAADSGIVLRSCVNPNNYRDSGYSRSCSGYGTYIIIQHPDGSFTRYNHLSQAFVSQGNSISKGQRIALSGNTGFSLGAHLDFKVYCSADFSGDVEEGQYRRDPLYYLPPIPETNIRGRSCSESPSVKAIYEGVSQATEEDILDALYDATFGQGGPEESPGIPRNLPSASVVTGQVYLLNIPGSPFPNSLVPDKTAPPVQGEIGYLGGAAHAIYVQGVGDELTLLFFQTETVGGQVVVRSANSFVVRQGVEGAQTVGNYKFYFVRTNNLYVEYLS